MSGLHYTKSGALDMRYSSSKAAMNASSSSGYSCGSTSGGVSGAGDGLHYSKSGALDMRYSSSKAAVNTSNSSTSYIESTSGRSSGADDSLHYTKSGALDMRYTSSKAAVSSDYQSSSGRSSSNAPSYSASDDLHYKKDGTLDMRYRSSKVASGLSKQLANLHVSQRQEGIPANVPVKSDGTPDMRTAAAKQWVDSAGASWRGDVIPKWVPTHKDGTINLSSPIGRAFASAGKQQPGKLRSEYWAKRALDHIFRWNIEVARREYVAPLSRPKMVKKPIPAESTVLAGRSLPQNTLQVEYSCLAFEDGDEKKAVIGQGAFGVVLKATLNGKKVAVKKLLLTQLSKKEKDAFCRELHILAHLGEHRNLVQLYAYCVTPPCLVMELVELGNLSYLLHYCEDRAVEAKMTDGRVKKLIVYGVANGMHQLHFSKIIHGDLKPQNILVTNDYEAKITDFGLATLRVKTTSYIASENVAANDDWEVAGTPGYMAPELLDSNSPPEFSSDVYSFGVLLNEVIAEEEPFADQYANFRGRGVFGAVNYAKQGGRPTISSTISEVVRDIITQCWSSVPRSRPTFKNIIAAIEKPDFDIPNSI